jgi:hypothetical protein
MVRRSRQARKVADTAFKKAAPPTFAETGRGGSSLLANFCWGVKPAEDHSSAGKANF